MKLHIIRQYILCGSLFVLCVAGKIFSQHDHGHDHSMHEDEAKDETSLFYSGTVSLDMQQSIEPGLRREFEIGDMFLGLGITINEQVESFIMVEKEAKKTSIVLHEAEISYFPSEKFSLSAGLFHMPFGQLSTELSTKPLIAECIILEEHMGVIHEIMLHSVETHAPGIRFGLDFDKVSLGGSYYISVVNDAAEEPQGYGHDHSGFGSHQGFTGKAQVTIGSFAELGAGSRLRIKDVINADTNYQEPKKITRADIDATVFTRISPHQTMAAVLEAYYTPIRAINPHAGNYFGYFTELDFYFNEKLTAALRYDSYVNSNRMEEEEYVRTSSDKEPETESLKASLVGVGLVYKITNNLALSSELRISKMADIVDRSIQSKIIFNFNL